MFTIQIKRDYSSEFKHWGSTPEVQIEIIKETDETVLLIVEIPQNQLINNIHWSEPYSNLFNQRRYTGMSYLVINNGVTPYKNYNGAEFMNTYRDKVIIPQYIGWLCFSLCINERLVKIALYKPN